MRNPYLTVDWMPIDLTVFNGEDLLTNTNLNDAAALNPLAAVLFTTSSKAGGSKRDGGSHVRRRTTSGRRFKRATSAHAIRPCGCTSAGNPAANFSLHKLSHTLGVV